MATGSAPPPEPPVEEQPGDGDDIEIKITPGSAVEAPRRCSLITVTVWDAIGLGGELKRWSHVHRGGREDRRRAVRRLEVGPLANLFGWILLSKTLLLNVVAP